MQPEDRKDDIELQRPKGAAKRFLPQAILVLLLAALSFTGVFETLNTALTDMRFRLLKRAPSDTLVIVEIDPESLREDARWPWPRDRYAQAIGNLQKAGAALIALDVDFSSLSDPAGDDEFAEALSRRPGEIVLPVFWQWSSRSAADGAVIKTPPHKKFLKDAIVASVTLTTEKNGIIRNGWRGINDGDTYRASMASVLAGAPPNKANTFLIDYSIDPTQIKRLSFHDVLVNSFPAEAVRGKNILIGATALELGDEFAAPVLGITPGATIHALSYESIISGRTLVRPHFVIPLAFALALLFWLSLSGRKWRWRKFIAVHSALFVVIIGTPVLIQAYFPVSFDVGVILVAQFLSFSYVVGARLRQYAHQIIRHRAATAHYQALTALVVRDNTDGVIVADHEGRVELCNDRARELLGLDARFSGGSLISELVPDFPLYVNDEENRDAKNQDSMVYEPRLLEFSPSGADGLTLEIVFSRSSIGGAEAGDRKDRNSRVFVYTLRDISARKRIEEAEREAKEAAIAANRMKSQLIANMSHELRTPLNGVIGFADILQKEAYGPLGTAEYKDYAESIYVSGNRLLSVFNDMLHIAKLDSGDFELSKSDASLNEIVESSLSKYEEQAEKEGKNFRVETPKEMTRVEIDVSVFREVLNKLLSNAFKYTSKGADICLRAARRGDDLLVEVEDNGCGAAKECLPKLTEAFYQADGALNRQFEGAGLGLYVVSKFVELHGGEVSFESEPGAGFLARVRFNGAARAVRTGAAA